MIWPFRRKLQPRKQVPNIAAIVDTTLRNHPSECIFAPGARERIIAKVESAGLSLRDAYSPALIDCFEAAVKAEEIYCPHEGIDRRAEFGLISEA